MTHLADDKLAILDAEKRARMDAIRSRVIAMRIRRTLPQTLRALPPLKLVLLAGASRPTIAWASLCH